jgi:hypothetical protein
MNSVYIKKVRAMCTEALKSLDVPRLHNKENAAEF